MSLAGDSIAPITAVADPLAKLREPFAAHQMGKLPKPTKQQTEIVKADFKKGVRCPVCAQWHHPDVVHLDYVGHAALTDRLLDVDRAWTWEPMGLTANGLPAFDAAGGLWIKLTVCGVTRIGYGDADGKAGGAAIKEAIGDALRNGGMRFGAALELWHKGDLHVADADLGQEGGPPLPDAADMAIALMRGCAGPDSFKEVWSANQEGWQKVMTDAEWARTVDVFKELRDHYKAKAAAGRPAPPRQELGEIARTASGAASGNLAGNQASDRLDPDESPFR